MHEYDWLYLVSEYLHWLWQLVKVLAPFIEPDQEPETPPNWWYEYSTWWEWYYPLKNNNWRPTEQFCRSALWMLRRIIGDWVVEEAIGRRDQAVSIVRGFTGYVQDGYTTFESWIAGIRNRVGTWVPWWASHLADAANKLYHWLPEDIRTNIRSWAEKLRALQEEVWDWVQDRYEEARQFAYNAINWITNLGQAVRSWWEQAHDWLDDFRHHAYERITSWLGTPWRKLVTFAEAAIDYYYNLWSAHWQEIAAFFDNPLLWLYDRVEDFLISKW